MSSRISSFLLRAAVCIVSASAATALIHGCSARESVAVDSRVLVRDHDDLVNASGARPFQLRFARDGASIRRATDQRRLNLRGVAFGRGDETHELAEPTVVTLEGARATYARGAVVEWYESQQAGLEQGFTIASTPVGTSALHLDVDVGDFDAVASDAGGAADAIELRSADGAASFHYGALSVVDALGHAVPAHLSAPARHTVRIVVDDRAATYPIVVDPLVWSFRETLTPAVQLAGDNFGTTVSLRGDTLVVGAPSRAGDQGGLTIFQRSASSWTEGATLEILDAGAPELGRTLDFDGTRIIGGSLGPALIYARNGATWSLEQALHAPWFPLPGQPVSVAIDGERAVLLIPQQYASLTADGGVAVFDASAGPPPGAIFIYEHDATTGWSLKTGLGLPLVENVQSFGRVILVKDRIFVALQNVVVVYVRAADGTWSIEAGFGPQLTAFYGIEIAATDSVLLVSDIENVYTYMRDGSTWALTGKLAPTLEPNNDCFGCFMATDGDTAFVGDANFPTLFRYRRVGSTWTLEEVIKQRASSVGAAGEAVALGGATAAIGNALYGGERGAVSVYSVQHSQGDACSAASDCASGFCVDGACCDTACGNGAPDDCLTCARPDAVGTCSAAPATTACRPAVGSCDVAESCDGENTVCPANLQKANGTPCGAESACNNGVCQGASASNDASAEASPEPAGASEAASDGCTASSRHLPGGAGSLAAGALLLLALLARRRARRAGLVAFGVVASTLAFAPEEPQSKAKSLDVQSRDASVRARFDATGPSFSTDLQGPAWSLTTAAFGRAASMHEILHLTPVQRERRIRYEHSEFIEWYEPRESDIEQGFDVLERPAGDGPLVIRMAVSGSRRGFGYGKLAVLDARGVALDARLVDAGSSLEIRVDDAHATYPVMIDPSIWRERQRFVPRIPSLGPLAAAGSVMAFQHTGVPPTAVEVFRQGTAAWTREAELVPFRFIAETEELGEALAVSGDTLAAGAPFAPYQRPQGSVFMFEHRDGAWVEDVELTPPFEPFDTELFGFTLDLDGDTLAVGALNNHRFPSADPTADNYGDPTKSTGAVFIYTREQGVWTPSATLTGPPSAPLFGAEVKVKGTTLLVAATGYGTPSFWLYDLVGTTWQLRTVLADPAPLPVSIGLASAAIDGDTLVFFGRSIFVYQRTGTTWAQVAVLQGSDDDVLFYDNGAVRGTRIAAGSTSANDGKGALYIFDRDATGKWSQTARLTASDGAPNDALGSQVALPSATEVFAAAVTHGASGQVYDFRLGPEALTCTAATVATDCSPGAFCVDGFCCDTACGGDDPNDCQACSVAAGAAHDGICAPVAPRVCRPARDECDVEDRCDGTNVVCPADLVAENGHVCAAGTCTAGKCALPPSIASRDAGAPVEPEPTAPSDGDCSCRAAGLGSATSTSTSFGGSFGLAVAAIAIGLARRTRNAQRPRRATRTASRRALAAAAALLSTLLVLCWWGGVARADEGQPANTASALAKFDEGRHALEAGDFAVALAAFDASNQLLGSPNSVLYMARCYKGLGKTASAYTSFRLAYRQAQDRLVATSDRRYAATRDSAAHEAAEIEADVPKLAIFVPEGAPASVVVTQNGVPLPRSSWGTAIDTDPGHVVVEVIGLRLEPFHEELDLPSGETRRIDVRLVRVPTASLRIHLDSRPLGLALRLDGNPIDATDLATPRELDPGTRVVEATAPGHIPFRWEARLADGEIGDVRVRLVEQRIETKERRATTPRWLFWTTAGVAVVTLGTGSVLATHASVRASNQRDEDPLLRSSSSRDSIRSESTAANVLFVAGAVVATGAVILAFTTDWKGQRMESPPKTARLVDTLTTGARF